MWRVGIDVGGTFTDLFAWEEDHGTIATAKVLTTKDDRTQGVFAALDAARIPPEEISYLAHGSTTATNALVERSYPRTALVTSEGFRDTIEIGRQHREYLYDPYQQKPTPLIPRRFRFTVPGRMSAKGVALEPLNEAATIALALKLKALDVKSVAIAFINAYAAPEHETRVRDILLEHCPGIYVAVSSETKPKFRELGRFVTTVVRAVLLPVMADYFTRLDESLAARGFNGSFLVLKGNGGVMGVDLARERPEELIESGPAGGVAYASYLSEQLDLRRIIHTDMGGTTFDASIVEDGHGLVTHDYELEWDLPLIVPMLDIRSIGAGGGSIAWIDPGGSLRVGPRSAGSDPGPICYGLGGEQVTVTDANLVLGRLGGDLGGKLELDARAAERALAELAERVGLEPLRAAEGIIAICCENMAQAIKMVLVDRGRDPRDFVLASFGGAGPMHACFIARAMNIPKVLVPGYAGVASSFGATVMDIRHDVETFFYAPVADTDLAVLNETYDHLEDRARGLLGQEALALQRVSTLRSTQMRYIGQSYEVNTPVPSGTLGRDALSTIIAGFNREHEREYGVSTDVFPPAFVNLGVTAVGHIETPAIFSRREQSARDPRIRRRQVFFDGRWHETAVYDGEALAPGFALSGPAIVEYSHSCVILPLETAAQVDDFDNLVVTINA